MKLSVLIITYNHEKFIAKAIESVLMQRDCAPFEIIVCDDHSTDQTVTIAESLLVAFANVRVYSNEKNIGITRNYQHAFSLCHGDYIFVLEGDDYWTDDLKINKQTMVLDNHPGCMSCSHFYYTEKEGTEGLLPPALQKEEEISFFTSEDIILDPFIGNNFSTCCYRRTALQNISPGTYDIISYEWMINISVSQFGRAAVINQPMSIYRVAASGSWSKLPEQEQLRGMIEMLPKYDAVLQHHYHSAFEKKTKMLRQQLHALEQARQAAKNQYTSVNKMKYLLMRLFARISKDDKQ